VACQVELVLFAGMVSMQLVLFLQQVHGSFKHGWCSMHYILPLIGVFETVSHHTPTLDYCARKKDRKAS
jgi:hypothetical protein